MCSPTRCRICDKTTWKGCGQHVAQVKSKVPAYEWCPGHPEGTETQQAGGFLSRLFGK